MIGTTSCGSTSRRDSTGSAMLLVLVAMVVAFTLGLAFLSRSTRLTHATHLLTHHSQSRHAAESAIALLAEYLERTPGWYQQLDEGEWLHEFELPGGQATVTASFGPDPIPHAAILDPSFEEGIGELETPTFAPPMTGTIGEWDVWRTALIESGGNVPLIRIEADHDATDGANVARIAFGLGVSGSAGIRQSLGVPLAPNAIYEMQADIGLSGLMPLDTRIGIRLLADDTVVASTEHAHLLKLPFDLGDLPEPPETLPSAPELDSIVQVLALDDGFSTYTLLFQTDSGIPDGILGIELFAESIAILSDIRFDNVRLSIVNTDPVTLTSTAMNGPASHRVIASLQTRLDETGTPRVRIVSWHENR